MSNNAAYTQSSFWMRRRFYILTPLVIFLLFAVFIPKPSRSRWNGGTLQQGAYVGTSQNPRETAANATLGFEKLIALSTGPSWRTRGLLKAAEFTGLDFTIPVQPKNPPELINAFEKIGSEREGATLPNHGSAIAWMAHLDLLKYVIASNFSSAFIVEDDVDWDLKLFDQMRLISDNVRTFMNADPADPRPFGGGWDVLWLGHCGELSNENNTRLMQYNDDTRCTTEQYGGWSKRYLRQWIPDGVRVVQEVVQPVCTFGYGVTKESAQKVLQFLATGVDEAFDVGLQHHCTAGRLKCISVNPEIMHHYEPPPELGYVSQVKEGDGKGHAANEAAFETVMGKTANIVYSARCKALFDDTCLAAPWEF